MKRESRTVLLSCLVMAMVFSAAQAHESPVERVGRMLRIWTDGSRLWLRYEAEYSERSVLLELHAMDANGDGAIQNEEQTAFLTTKANALAEHFRVRIGDASLTPTHAGPVVLKRDWRQICDFSVPITDVPAGTNDLRLTIQGMHVQPGEFQWTIGRGEKEDGPIPSEGKASLSARKAQPAAHSANRKQDCIELDFTLITAPIASIR
ncbi:MAG: hypothetical protein FJ224_07815 [Lentisphaerae bacterium]|nr:hypothetical protein [Lentisphaerota bacterium]